MRSHGAERKEEKESWGATKFCARAGQSLPEAESQFTSTAPAICELRSPPAKSALLHEPPPTDILDLWNTFLLAFTFIDRAQPPQPTAEQVLSSVVEHIQTAGVRYLY